MTDSTSLPSAISLQQLRERHLERLRERMRPGQREIAAWQGGRLAVSAVPGAGKSTGMAVGAAIAIARHRLHPKHQLVVVTFTRSAAAALKAKIRAYLQELNLPPGGFVVQTLHGLALNIATRHPELSGLNLETATVVTPDRGHRLMKTAVERWIASAPRTFQCLLEGQQFDGEDTERLRRDQVLRTEILPGLARTAVREAKSSGLRPQDLLALAQETQDDYQVLTVAAGLYEQFERAMRSREFVDYDDMILGALRALANEEVRHVWQQQTFAVFEDEAQDSSPLQAELLNVLAATGDRGGDINLVRVGDPNQAINSTFTPADPLYFNWFCERCRQDGRLATIAQAGRSTPILIEAANFALSWVNRFAQPRVPADRDMLALPFRPQQIQPVAPEDPQPDANPAPAGKGLEIYAPEDVFQTAQWIGARVRDLLTGDRERSVAVLVRENRQGRFVARALVNLQRDYDIRVYEVSEVERYSEIPVEMLKLLRFLDRPHSVDNLKAALEVLAKRNTIPTQDLNALAIAPEQFLYPGPLDQLPNASVQRASKRCRQLLQARTELPHYQLIAFLGLALQYAGSELATVQKLADRVARQTLGSNSLKQTLNALEEIVSSERFEGVDDESDDAYARPNQVTILTMHKAKGLDWDYVFLPFLHADSIPGEPWVPTAARFLGDFTLAEVARAQIRAAVHARHLDAAVRLPEPGEAWQQAGYLKQAEEFRLLYVAMTRAKRLLWMSAAKRGPFRWNLFDVQSPDRLRDKVPCPVVTALRDRFPEAIEDELPF
ncbi:ATP-dependent helicase [Rubidibacter lacunae]